MEMDGTSLDTAVNMELPSLLPLLLPRRLHPYHRRLATSPHKCFLHQSAHPAPHHNTSHSCLKHASWSTNLIPSELHPSLTTTTPLPQPVHITSHYYLLP